MGPKVRVIGPEASGQVTPARKTHLPFHSAVKKDGYMELKKHRSHGEEGNTSISYSYIKKICTLLIFKLIFFRNEHKTVKINYLNK